jgi:hypothetical protein
MLHLSNTKIILTSFVVFFILILILSIYGIKNSYTGSVAIANYQLNKIQDIDIDIDIVIVGDSTGGNGIDSNIFKNILGRNVVSLSLGANFGYDGTYYMAKEAIDRGAKTVVIVHSVDMLTREYELTLRHLMFLHEIVLSNNIISNFFGFLKIILNKDFIFENLKAFIKNDFPITLSILENIFNFHTRPVVTAKDIFNFDYIPQGEKINNKNITLDLEVKSIKSKMLPNLFKLASYCKDKQVDCLYFYGPVHNSFCEKGGDYMLASSKAILSTGISFVSNDIYCMESEEIGDGYDHIHPNYKHMSTKFYAEKVKNFYKNKSKGNFE